MTKRDACWYIAVPFPSAAMAPASGGSQWTFTYNADGMRIQRSNGTMTYKYVYNGSQLSQMTVGNQTLYFTYDASGTPLSVTYYGVTYYYVTNLQGDVVAILDSAGSKVVSYTYDAWGNIMATAETAVISFGAWVNSNAWGMRL